MQSLSSKLSSRKFWMAVAAFLASIGTSVGAFATDNGPVAAVGIVCAMLSAAIYAAAEAYVDGQSLQSNANISSTTTTKTISAASSNARETVEKLLANDSTVSQE